MPPSRFGWLVRSNPFVLRLRTVRILTIFALFGYPAGVALETARDNAGNWLIIPSGLAIMILMLSRADRLFVDDAGELDEYERSQGAKALRYTYWVLVFLVLAFWVVASFGTITISDDTAEKLGFLLFAWLLILPMAIQAWWLRHPFDREETLGNEEEAA